MAIMLILSTYSVGLLALSTEIFILGIGIVFCGAA